MQISSAQSLDFIKEFIDNSNNWAEVEKQILEHNFKDVLRAEDYIQIHTWWHEKGATLLSDYTLASEIDFWAKGGTFKTHLDGFFAIPVNYLINEARIRNWQFQEFPSSMIIKPPNNKPIAIPKK